ncbi:MAG TPA: NAD-dependent succinate-semialdehyde dehydrogenase [Gemmatimonadaceae bacterium]|nr:NAD-dependent succinate-semialdehyde dehydrogenase [Gemmatimonadaceae bacterium]
MTIASINPTTGETLRTFTAASDADIERVLARASEAFREHRALPVAERARRMRRAAEILEGEQREWGRLMTLEMGKPIGAARDEAAKCARACRYYAEHAERFLADEPVKTQAARSYVAFQPLGVVLAVMPWNFPFWQVVRFAAPALMAGNVGILKHASNVPQCALALEEIFRRAGFAEGTFSALLVGSDAVQRIIEDPRVAAVTLTGSEGAGRSVGAAAGRVIKKSVLELGGSDPFIVMPSADLDAAVSTAVKARTINNGQSCIAAKRFIVHERIAEVFERRFVRRMESLTIGDPMDESTDIGPLATADIRRDLDEQVRATVRAGARLLTGGKPIEGKGNFYPPTVLADIPPESPAYREELFGPVASIFRARDIDEAIAIANDTTFGLGSSAWTTDDAECERFVRELEAGQVFINAMVASDPRLPFGGVKRSGSGRELGPFGLREFVNIKTVWIEKGGEATAGERTE